MFKLLFALLLCTTLIGCAATSDSDSGSGTKGSMMTSTSEVTLNTQLVNYKHGDTTLEGYISYRSDTASRKAAVLVVHNWMGLSDTTKQTCDELARLGYVAFAADIYGKGVRPTNTAEAGAQATKYRSDRPLLRARANAGLEWLKKHSMVDPKRVAAIGYCFGGGTVLELARSGADFRAAVCFHGNLDTPNIEDAKNIKARVLVCHGADDPYVPQEQVAGFIKEMQGTKADWQLIQFGDAVHSFTDLDAGSDKSKGSAYNEIAARRSWQSMQRLFSETIDRKN